METIHANGVAPCSWRASTRVPLSRHPRTLSVRRLGEKIPSVEWTAPSAPVARGVGNPACFVARVGVGTEFKECANGGEVVDHARYVQRCLTPFVPGVHVQPGVHQQGDDFWARSAGAPPGRGMKRVVGARPSFLSPPAGEFPPSIVHTRAGERVRVVGYAIRWLTAWAAGTCAAAGGRSAVRMLAQAAREKGRKASRGLRAKSRSGGRGAGRTDCLMHPPGPCGVGRAEDPERLRGILRFHQFTNSMDHPIIPPGPRALRAQRPSGDIAPGACRGRSRGAEARSLLTRPSARNGVSRQRHKKMPGWQGFGSKPHHCIPQPIREPPLPSRRKTLWPLHECVRTPTQAPGMGWRRVCDRIPPPAKKVPVPMEPAGISSRKPRKTLGNATTRGRIGLQLRPIRVRTPMPLPPLAPLVRMSFGLDGYPAKGTNSCARPDRLSSMALSRARAASSGRALPLRRASLTRSRLRRSQ